MEITIRHREDAPRAGHSSIVRFHHAGIPVFHGSAASLAALYRALSDFLEERPVKARERWKKRPVPPTPA